MSEMAERVATGMYERHVKRSNAQLRQSGYPSSELMPAWPLVPEDTKDRWRVAARDAVDVVPIGWQPIETAPKDGERVILFYADQYDGEPIAIGRWFEWCNGEFLWCMDTGERWSCPSHWMPLPMQPTGDAT